MDLKSVAVHLRLLDLCYVVSNSFVLFCTELVNMGLNITVYLGGFVKPYIFWNSSI